MIKSVFHFIRGELGFSSIMNLLATRINTQLRTFVFYRAGLNCVAENVFLINWEKEKFYAFLPLACLPQTLQKIYQDKAKGILIGPDWPSQPYYPRIIEIFLQTTSIPPRKKKLISTKPNFTTLPTSQKNITASLLSRWGNDTLTKNVKD